MPDIEKLKDLFYSIESAKKSYLNSRIYRAICPNIYDAEILKQVIYWERKSKLHKNKCTWVAKTYKDWWVELGINRSTARRSILRLNDMRLTCTQVHQFAGRPVQHIRIIWDSFLDSYFYHFCNYLKSFYWFSEDQSIGPLRTSSVRREPILYIDLYKELNKYLFSFKKTFPNQNLFLREEEINQIINKLEDILEIKKPDRSKRDSKEINRESKVTIKKPKQRSILPSVSNLKIESYPVPPKKINITGMTSFWVKKSMEIYYEQPEITMTQKNINQLRLIMKFLSDQDVYDVLQDIISNWDGFCSLVSEGEGLDRVPKYPNIGFLLVHRKYMVQFHKIGKEEDLPVDKNEEGANILSNKIEKLKQERLKKCT
jgi:hypothetical protein